MSEPDPPSSDDEPEFRERSKPALLTPNRYARTKAERPSGRVPGHRGGRNNLATAATMDSEAGRPRAVDLGMAQTQDSRDGSEQAGRGDAELDGLGRFVALGSLGVGGMGEVLRVRDPELKRVVALKILSAGRVSESALSRFRDEAQLTAQLQHPGIVPVYELGHLPDGRIYYTMQEVRGRTLDDVIDEAHLSSNAGAPMLRRLVDVCRQACEAVAYAHSRGVIHRDLKPANIMVGEFGEVRVMDWGIAKALGAVDADWSEDGDIESVRQGDASLATRVGEIMGTPMYMAPEQARGEVDNIGPASDVFALGSVLYKAISGDFPYPRDRRLLPAVQTGATLPLTSPFPLATALREIVAKALAPRIADRYSTAAGLARALTGWLEGARARATALAHVDDASRRTPEISELHERARALRAEAQRMLAPLESYTPVTAKRAAWDLEARARGIEHEAELAEAAREESLRLALHHAPDLPEAHAALARLHEAHHREAEKTGAVRTAIRYEARLKTHLEALPPSHPVRVELADYLEGMGRLSLTAPLPVEARLYRYEVQDRRVVEVFDRELGLTPLIDVQLPRGNYVVHLGRVRYPIRIERQGHWDGVPPGREAAPPIPMPQVGEHEVYVPGGWALLGEQAQPVWVDGFVMLRQPVSNGAYLAFINDLVAADRAEDAVRFAPRTEGAGGYSWRTEYPAVRVSYEAAEAYGRWRAEAEGLPWRLPSDAEWEKAARGVDGRRYPWGNAHDPTWCRMRDSQAGPPELGPIQAVPLDVSPYGVHGLGGNVRDWIQGWYDPKRRIRRVARGGAFEDDANGALTWQRFPFARDARPALVGFRLVRALEP